MIKTAKGDLFLSGAEVLVNATNTEGIMGAGIALAFKQRYPEMFNAYRDACERGTHTVSQPFFWWNYYQFGSLVYEPHILNLATKDKIREPSKLSHIEAGLIWLAKHYVEEGMRSIAFPALGCGLGGLSWKAVKPLMVELLTPLDLDVTIYEPQEI